jgi:hypothetical protein
MLLDTAELLNLWKLCGFALLPSELLSDLDGFMRRLHLNYDPVGSHPTFESITLTQVYRFVVAYYSML